jgi:hypothetical protein
MNPGEKYSKVLILRKKKVYKAEDECGFGRNTLTKAIKEDRELSEEYHKKFMTQYAVNPVWWDTGKGDVLIEKGTSGIELAGKSKDVSEEIRLLILNLNRFGETNEYLLKRIKDLGG